MTVTMENNTKQTEDGTPIYVYAVAGIVLFWIGFVGLRVWCIRKKVTKFKEVSNVIKLNS